MKQSPVALGPQDVFQLDPDLALKGYTKDPEWMYKTGLGGTLNAAALLISLADPKQLTLPIGIAILCVTNGFVLRTIRMRLREPAARLSDWTKWNELLVSGLIWISIQFCISMVAAGLISSGLMLAYMAITRGQAPTILVGEMMILYVIAILVWTSLFSSFLMINFAHEQKVLSGLAVRKIMRTIRANPKTMLTAWLLSTAIQAFAIVATATTVLGIFLLPSIYFAAQLIGTTILTQAWRATLPDEFPP